MRELVRQFVRICVDALSLEEPIYEFGSLQVPEQGRFADLRPFFRNRRYVGADMRPGPGVDVILDLHAIDLPVESAGTVLILDTLEHVEYARKGVEEAHRILKRQGILIVSSHMDFPIHNHPHDYWRSQARLSTMEPPLEGANRQFMEALVQEVCPTHSAGSLPEVAWLLLIGRTGMKLSVA